MWLTLPANVDRMVDEKEGQYVGAVYNSMIPAEIEDYIRGQFARTPSCQWTTGVTVATQDVMSRQFQYWVAGALTDAKFLKAYDKSLHQGAVDMIEALGIDTTGWVDGYDSKYSY